MYIYIERERYPSSCICTIRHISVMFEIESPYQGAPKIPVSVKKSLLR